MNEKKLKSIDFVSIFFRTFFIQAVWNFQSLLSVGLCFCLMPVAKRLYSTPAEHSAFLKRHLCFFNAHPYFASFALGAIARLEQDHVNGIMPDSQQIDRLKNALIGPLGAVGDQYFWLAMRPASLLLGFLAIAVIQEVHVQLIFLLLLLILYNVPHFYTRLSGLLKGYRDGFGIYKVIKTETFAPIRNIYTVLGSLFLGIFIGFKSISTWVLEPAQVFIFAGSTVIAYYLRTRKQQIYLPILLPLILALILGMI